MADWRQVAFGLLKQWEGCKLHAYPDPATGGKPFTIGYGATGEGIGPDTVWTQAQADGDLQRRVEALGEAIEGLAGVPLNAMQLGALVSLAYNIGLGAFGKSTLLRKLKAMDYAGAEEQFLVWNQAAGKVMQGLVNRRNAERSMFLSQEPN
jgi:lysozyme